MKFDAEETRDALQRSGFTNVEIGPSNVVMSPHDYVFVWLTPKEHEGLHAIVSDLREYEDRDGFLVGVYQDWVTGGPSYTVDTLDEAVLRTQVLVKYARSLRNDRQQRSRLPAGYVRPMKTGTSGQLLFTVPRAIAQHLDRNQIFHVELVGGSVMFRKVSS